MLLWPLTVWQLNTPHWSSSIVPVFVLDFLDVAQTMDDGQAWDVPSGQMSWAYTVDAFSSTLCEHDLEDFFLYGVRALKLYVDQT